MNTTYDDYLTHYGVKGMRWGVRKKLSSNSSKSVVSKMSDSDLQSKTKRLNLESEYKEALSRHNKAYASSKHKLMTSIQNSYTTALGQVIAKELIKGTVAGGTALAGGTLIKKVLSK